MFKKIFIISILLLLLSGCWDTGSGMQTGTITGIKKTGIFFRTYDAYLQTSDRSSVAHKYCVINDNIAKKLELASKNGNRITVKFHSELLMMPWKCGDSNYVIDGVVNE
jgi:hypothetical protein